MDQSLQNVAEYVQRVRAPYRAERRTLANQIRPGMRILELGCGDGRVTAELVRTGARVAACDLSFEALRRLRARGSGRTGAVIFQADARRLPVPTGSVDVVVFAFNGIDFLVPAAERIKVLSEAERVLAPGGRFIFSSHNGLGRLLTPRGAWSPRSWWERFTSVRAGTLRGGYAESPRGLVIYQATPRHVIDQVRSATGLRYAGAWTGRSGVRAPLWLLSVASKWPYYRFVKPSDRDRRSARGKRVLDVAASGVALVALSPLLLMIAGLIRLMMGRPVIFAQTRPGLGGKTFTLYKFRTMRDLHDADGRFLADSDRLTRLGRLLRATSLDELPELFNVLRGDMSLVGPRPLLPEYLDRYSPDEARRHEVRPGITGLAQVRGRNALEWDEKFELDVFYVDNRTFLLDLKILALTVSRWFRRDGISSPGHATMPEFQRSDLGAKNE